MWVKTPFVARKLFEIRAPSSCCCFRCVDVSYSFSDKSKTPGLVLTFFLPSPTEHPVHAGGDEIELFFLSLFRASVSFRNRAVSARSFVLRARRANEINART